MCNYQVKIPPFFEMVIQHDKTPTLLHSRRQTPAGISRTHFRFFQSENILHGFSEWLAYPAILESVISFALSTPPPPSFLRPADQNVDRYPERLGDPLDGVEARRSTVRLQVIPSTRHHARPLGTCTSRVFSKSVLGTLGTADTADCFSDLHGCS